ncbi:ATP-binding protein [Bacterioplanoides sp.]|uniref:ATP-binding protein n=1 Tax=Bacterioplanoides sp. TaxID=2066072 RepID=UPI003B58BA9A
MATLSQTKVDMSGLIEVLGQNLYSTPTVAIRELIQNAHDACIRHSIEDAGDNDYRIRINCIPGKLITIQDNGSGLTYQEINDFLATIGSGYTRLLRDQTNTEDMIGYFGLGFLSAYVVADKVEVITASYQTPDQTWTFLSKGGQSFSISETENKSRGTELKLYLKAEFSHLASENFLKELIKKYCPLLPIQIFFNEDEKPLNDLVPPWRYQGSALAQNKKMLEFSKNFEPSFDPICCFPIMENELDITGCIWIQNGTTYSSSDQRNMNVFVRNMYITNNAIDLLPKWAGFAGCVINTASLTPTASREDIQKDKNYSLAQDILQHSLISGLKVIADQQPENWRRILKRHNQGLTGAAIADDDLFFMLKDELTVPTTLGDVTIPALLKSSNNQIHIQPEESGGFQKLLYKAQMIPIVQGFFFAATAFCTKYKDVFPQIKVLTLGKAKDELSIFPKIDVDSTHQQLLSDYFSKENEELIITKFEPDFIPLIIVEDEDHKLKSRLESDEADKRIGSALLGLARISTKNIDSSVHRRLYLNKNNPIISEFGNLDSSKRAVVSNLLRSHTFTMNSSPEADDISSELKSFFSGIYNLAGL